MSIKALKKTIVKEDGGVYQDAVHKVTDAFVNLNAGQNSFVVRLTTFKDEETAEAGGVSARVKHYNLDTTSDGVKAAFSALSDLIYAHIKAVDEELADAEDVLDDDEVEEGEGD